MALNRAVAVAEVEGPAGALALVDGLELDGYHLFHAIRADLLRRRPTPRPPWPTMPPSPAENTAERAFLQGRRRALAGT